MSFGIQSTLVFVSLIVVGFFLQKKISSPEETKGIKSIILNLALPATIFIALLKIEIERELLLFPLITLLLNVLMMLGAYLVVTIMNVSKDSAVLRSILLLFPSFAPGLSCFPFLMEYFGEEALANAAFADVGNKIFVLIILYVVAMRWHYNHLSSRDGNVTQRSKFSKLKELGMALLREPINSVLFIALIMIILGWNMNTLPFFIGDSIQRLSILMTPLILLFIGLSFKVSREDISFILQLLLWRSGIGLVLSGILIFILPSNISTISKILILIFPQSACSFWPYAHMSAIHSLDKENENDQSFDLTFSLNLLAFSLPISTIIILGLCSYSNTVTSPGVSLWLGGIILSFALVLHLIKFIQSFYNSETLTSEKDLRRESLKA